MAPYPADWDRRRREAYARDEYTCQNCGAQGGTHGDAELHAHHIVPALRGGTHEPSNLTALCVDCHAAVHNEGVRAPTFVGSPDQHPRERPADAPEVEKPGKSNGRWWIHLPLLVFTFGIGNVLYWIHERLVSRGRLERYYEGRDPYPDRR
jgi:hypothetical protein